MDKILNSKIEEFFRNGAKGHLPAGQAGIYRCVIDDAERILVEKALEHSSGNQITASKILGVNRNTLRSKIKKFNINTGRYKA